MIGQGFADSSPFDTMWPAGAPSLTRVASGEHLFHEGDPVEAIFEIVSGVVVIYRTSIDGCRLIHDLRFRGELVGLGYGQTYATGAIAMRPTTLRRISRAAMERCLDEDPATVRRMLEAMTLEITRTSDRLMVIGSRTAIGRVATCLLDLSNRMAGGTDTFILPISRSQMADYLGLTVETVSRSMTRLKTLRVIALPRSNTIVIRDRVELQTLAHEDGAGAARGRLLEPVRT